MCLTYFLLILQLKQFDYLICFCLFSPCLQCGRMRKCGFLGSWKKLTEMFHLQLGLVPRNIPESPGGQAEGLWVPRVSVSYPELRPQLKDWSTGRADSLNIQSRLSAPERNWDKSVTLDWDRSKGSKAGVLSIILQEPALSQPGINIQCFQQVYNSRNPFYFAYTHQYLHIPV